VQRRRELESRLGSSEALEIRVDTNRELEETIRTVVGTVWAAL
jgi:hypothetical protein